MPEFTGPRIKVRVPALRYAAPPAPSGPRVATVPVRGPIGPAGPVGPSGAGYTHTQATPAGTWVITHNLGRPVEPTVLLNGAPTTPVYTDVAHPSLNQTTLVFPTPVAGVAHF